MNAEKKQYARVLHARASKKTNDNTYRKNDECEWVSVANIAMFYRRIMHGFEASARVLQNEDQRRLKSWSVSRLERTSLFGVQRNTRKCRTGKWQTKWAAQSNQQSVICQFCISETALTFYFLENWQNWANYLEIEIVADIYEVGKSAVETPSLVIRLQVERHQQDSMHYIQKPINVIRTEFGLLKL